VTAAASDAAGPPAAAVATGNEGGSPAGTRGGLLLAVAAYSVWGLLSPLLKLLLKDFTPLWLNALRAVLSVLVIVPLLGLRRTRAGLALLRRGDVLLIGLAGGGVTFLLFQLALVHQPATYTTLGFYTSPLWTALLARFALGERMGRGFLPAVVALGVGAWLALFGLGGGAGAGGADALGMALAVGSGATWAVYAVLLRRVGPVPARPLVLATFLVAAVFFLALALVFEPLPDLAAVPASAWARMGLLVAGPSVASVLLFSIALQRAPAGLVNVLVGFELAGTVLFAWLLLGETYDAARLLGIALVLVAVSAYVWNEARPRPAIAPE